jgi:RNA polymerase sigma-70 factor (ECF subfamily)
VRSCYHQIYRWALVQTGDPDEADDVTQDVLLVLHRKLKTFRARSRFGSWLFQVTRNAALQHGRKEGKAMRIKRKAHEVADAESPPNDTLQGPDDSGVVSVVRELFEQLPVRQREVFDLADLQGYSPAEIGEMLDMKAVTVRANLCKARRSIRVAILEQHPHVVEGLTE